LTREGVTNERPEWTPDGKRVLFRTDRSDQRGRSEIWWRPVDLSAPETRLAGADQLDLYEAVVSPDGGSLAIQADTAGADLYYRGLTGDTALKALVATPATEIMPRISPDGLWIAFVTDESGANQVVVQPFPGPGGRTQVSANGGIEPVWSRDGRRLFYRGDGKLMAASVRRDPTFAVVARDTVFTDSYVFATNPHANYDVMPDGEHFVMLKSAGEGVLTVVVNWGEALRARMAGNEAR
jgi:Tol biopolymer transport system component